MLTFFYNIFIFPISQLIELSFLFFYRVFNNCGFALFGVSVAFSIFTLPFYFAAEKYQKIERDIQNRMKTKLDKIKAVFKSDERYMIISTFYRQNNYHPIFAMRSTFGLLIQIPFFIAAYSYISHLEMIKGVSFFFIKDLGSPDGLVLLNNIKLNILPVIMTLINIGSGLLYSKGFKFSDKIQLYAISILFLFLLYNSPSALVIYWTMNNIFSLIKNIYQKINNSKIIIITMLSSAVLFTDIYLLFFHSGDLPKRLLAFTMLSSVFLFPLIQKIYQSNRLQAFLSNNPSNRISFLLCLNSSIILFILNGWIVPSSLISSSVFEFSYIDSYTTPFPILFSVLQQSAGFFIIWPLIIYFIVPGSIRLLFSYLMIILSVVMTVNVFSITENFGFFTTTMTFSDPKPFFLIPSIYIINIVIIILTVILLIFLLLFLKKKIIITGQIIIITSLFILSVINTKQINDDFIIVREKHESYKEKTDIFTAEYIFSKTGRNILLIMLDSAVGSHIPYIFSEKPELYNMMNGFFYFPNCVSYANHTLIGALPVYGGYEYTPTAVNNRKTEFLIDKQQEAYLLLPKLFSDAGFSVKVTDPPFDNFMMTNLSVFTQYPELDAKNLIGKYTAHWLQENNNIKTISIGKFLKEKLIRFSFFKSAPLFLRLFIYDKGNWLSPTDNSKNKLTNTIINDYAFLNSLNNITSFNDTGDNYISIYSHLPHSQAFLQAPDYIPVQHVTNTGEFPFSLDSTYHLTIASFLLLGKWFEYLKENEVYDNTRIIIVSDHGRGSLNIHNNFLLPNGNLLFSYNPLLMVKDFLSYDSYKIKNDFMTNGDVPLLALEGIINNPINPFTKTPLKSDKDLGVNIAAIGAVSTYRHNKYGYNINKNQWLFVKENIFKPENWNNYQYDYSN